MDTFSLQRGSRPLLLSLPHDGTELPLGLHERLTSSAHSVPDTDWHVARLYEFAAALGASVIRPRYSRYLVDLNRPADDESLYPGQNTTGLCPLLQFDGEPVYLQGAEPTAEEIRLRLKEYWQPYHQALQDELLRLRAEFGRVVLWDGHSIRSVLPFLFEGRLPDFNLGTNGGASCSAELEARLGAVLADQDSYSHVLNGRFKGGYITRHYGQPEAGVQAIQLELAQCIYMNEDRFEYDETRAPAVQSLIRRLLECCL